ASLYRLFEPVNGVANYIRARRLEHAHQELVAAGLDSRRIAPIAHRYGFKSTAFFNRAYQQAYACTPGQSRARSIAGQKMPKNSVLPERIGLLADRLLE